MNSYFMAGPSAPAVLVFSLLMSHGIAAHADHSAAHLLDTIQVTASAPSTQNTLGDAKAEVKRTAGGATVVDAADLRDQRAGTLTDALQQAAGVFAQSRFGSQEMRLSMRGSGLQRTFHTRGITVLQDGVPLNLADGSGDFQSIDTLAANHIEIFRGANALQFGSGTLGGSINFVTDTGYTAGTEFRLEGGSDSYRRAYASSGVVQGPLDGFISIGHYEQDGFREHAEQRELRLTSNLGVRLGNGIENRSFLTLTRSDSALPGNLSKAQLQADPRQANAANQALALDQRRDTEVLRLANKSVVRPSDTLLTELSVYLARKELDHPIFQVLQQANTDVGVSLRLIGTAPLAGYRNRWVFGFTPQYGITHGDSFLNTTGSTALGARTDRYRQAASNLTVYGENQLALDEQWAVTAGAQAMMASRNHQDKFVPSGQSDSSYQSRYLGFSPKLGVIFTEHSAMQWFGNIAGSFEPPSFGESPQALAGGPLRAQRAVTAEVGGRGDIQNWSWDVSLYRATLRHELLSVQAPVGGNQTSGVTVNADRTVHQGLEAALAWHPTAWAQWRLNALYNDFRLDDDAAFGNSRLPGIPRFLLRSEWRAAWGEQFIAITTESADKTFIDFANSFSADRYTIFGIKAGGALRPELSWFVEARNLADQKYASSTGVIRNAMGSDQAQFLPGDGRSLYVGLTWTP
jgi:iron complex outermembrane recepter protein